MLQVEVGLVRLKFKSLSSMSGMQGCLLMIREIC